MLSLSNADTNKCFGVSFFTPPADSTGLPHILEHCVLNGSRKYPIKEPFVELLKGSLNTFLNAFTGSDITVYPVASQNLQDFYNLVDVYLDAVFFPNISERVLAQEGWHYAPTEDGGFRFGGVVYNEMKGAYSSPGSLIGRYVPALALPGYDLPPRCRRRSGRHPSAHLRPIPRLPRAPLPPRQRAILFLW